MTNQTPAYWSVGAMLIDLDGVVSQRTVLCVGSRPPSRIYVPCLGESGIEHREFRLEPSPSTGPVYREVLE